jgi:excisionase family DNA binding protein
MKSRANIAIKSASPQKALSAPNRLKPTKLEPKVERPNPYLRKTQMAELLQVSVRTLDNWMARRLIPYIRIGRTIRFRRTDLENNIGNLFEKRDR